jgi:hypothetical protein
MTKSRFKAAWNLRGPCVAALALVLFGCASSAGEPAAGFMNSAVQAAYLPLSGAAYLLFFRTRNTAMLPEAAPYAGEQVVAYGQGTDNGLRDAYGTVKIVNAPVLPNCPACHVQKAFTFESIDGRADAGPGFSGGPVVDRATGALVGITFGFRDTGDTRLMYAYDMARVRTELSAFKTARSVAQK